MRVEEGFQQVIHPDDHPYLDDPVLPSLLKRLLPEKVLTEVTPDLVRLGHDLVNHVRPLSPLVQQATLAQYNQWGRRVDQLNTSEGWRRLEDLAIREGYCKIPHERRYGPHSRVYSFAKTMTMTGDYHVIFCPLSMSDGAARVIELFGTDKMKAEFHPRLISSDPERALLSGQWMTERPGGSDVSQSETTATKVPDQPGDLGPAYELNGFKRFSSAAEGNMSLALARTGKLSDGSRGLSLFLVPLRVPTFPTPLSNGVRLHRLKNKIGTWGVPTAELSLDKTRAWLIGPLNGGIKTIVPLLNLTRIHSGVHCVGSLQRCLSIARSLATVRKVHRGETLLKDIPMHVATLAQINLLYRALAQWTFTIVSLLGKQECGVCTPEEEARLRLMTPALKAFGAQRVPTAIEETMTAMGGLGYMEETGMGRLLRDVLVERIWEGTVNVLALDVMRASRDSKTVEQYVQWAFEIINSASSIKEIQPSVKTITAVVQKLPTFFEVGRSNTLAPRTILNLLAIVSCGLALLEHAVWSVKTNQDEKEVDLEAFRRWVDEAGGLGEVLKEYEDIQRKTEERVILNTRLVWGVANGKGGKAKL
ncbi:acyl-CoA dehydrogenase NM domain-like protein [Dendrothele bispora CBS 962.96]|uniref:Acyl-CoA dehydrogenase NM domain-like protein n=1 Tax=Dendrothele bispora (strain CBS 962.96) TaxID=1314807 RepID=A0A4S8M4M6_DENBC|nr:acyl-CoA dehydrogenase NM domain-like protein [Dendrothele bispora CBS 962.96]